MDDNKYAEVFENIIILLSHLFSVEKCVHAAFMIPGQIWMKGSSKI